MYGSVTCLINKKDFKNQHMVLQPKVPWIFLFIYCCFSMIQMNIHYMKPTKEIQNRFLLLLNRNQNIVNYRACIFFLHIKLFRDNDNEIYKKKKKGKSL